MDHITLDIEIRNCITDEQAWHYCIVPKSIDDNVYTFYIDENAKVEEVKDELEILFGKTIQLEKIATDRIKKTISKYYRKSDYKRAITTQTRPIDFNHSEDFLHKLIEEAKHLGSSDIHIETYEERCRVRLRIDGKLIERYQITKDKYPALVNKVKIKANIDIAEKRLPQDGRIIFKTDDFQFDIRVSVLPTLNGEKIVMRLLNKDSTNIEISELGFTPLQLEHYLEGIKKTHGIILISGPTGSGKTTTLYATLKVLNHERTNILTIEDPIEYTLEGVNQVQLKEAIGLTFASALRTFLRQDPDIIMLGEIRDAETAQMAIRAALTGHLVLSTIHTNSAWGIVSRLIDMGVPSFLLASTLNVTIAQRLVRVLCSHCKEEQEFTQAQLPKTYHTTLMIQTHSVAKGCEHCYYTGYKGRKAIYEVIPIDYALSAKIKENTYHIAEELDAIHVTDLAYNALELVKKHETTI